VHEELAHVLPERARGKGMHDLVYGWVDPHARSVRREHPAWVVAGQEHARQSVPGHWRRDKRHKQILGALRLRECKRARELCGVSGGLAALHVHCVHRAQYKLGEQGRNTTARGATCRNRNAVHIVDGKASGAEEDLHWRVSTSDYGDADRKLTKRCGSGSVSPSGAKST
jgi:hypothetical protein